MILKKALTILMTLAIVAAMATGAGAEPVDDNGIIDDTITDESLNNNDNNETDEEFPPVEGGDGGILEGGITEEEPVPETAPDNPYSDFDSFDDDLYDTEYDYSSFNDELTYTVARTWITDKDIENPVWVCRVCKTNMNGQKPEVCLSCNSTDITKTFGATLRALLGNIREDRDIYGDPTMNPTVAFFLIAFGAILVGFILSYLYKAVTKKGQPSSRNFAITLVILPIVVATVVFTIGENVGAGFGVAGIFSMTRFRSNATNSKDLAFVFVSVAIGFACGIGFLFYAFAIAFVLCAILLILNFAGYGELKADPKLLRINVPESISYGEVFDAVLEKYAYSWDVARVKTIDLGATFEITYSLMLKNDVNEKDFIDELRTRNGNLNIILRLDTRRESGM
ncbi:MAG: DUF4956 domain-containing protein [Oscillospiraceae bacterium]|nr:DUF4956 domain-containing protein [Oscillospiraceae bacterium]